MTGMLSTFLRSVTSLAAVLPALATLLVWFTSAQTRPLRWWILSVVAAPIVAFAVNRVRPTTIDADRAIATGFPQVVILLVMIALDVWLDGRHGYYVGGEAGMAHGIGLTVGVLGGSVLVLLVACS